MKMLNSKVSIACVLIVLAAGTLAVPRGFSLSQIQKFNSNSKSPLDNKAVKTEDGKLPTMHAVGLAANPENDENLFYADETALYEFDKLTGESTVVAGQASSGLLSMRSAVDGVEAEVSFKYITKIVSRPTGLYVFDYDRLRKYDYKTREVVTVTILNEEEEDQSESNAVIGVVSNDENSVYWTTTSGEGHMVMKMEIPNGKLDEAELVIGGPTLVGYMELSSDEEYLLLADIDMALVEKVKIADGDVTFVTKYGQEDFFPGALTMNGDDLYVVNRDKLSIDKYNIDESDPKQEALCDKPCSTEITDPFDIIYDSGDNKVYVLDSVAHPVLPIYTFFIKSISLGEEKTNDAVIKQTDFNDFMKFYSKWFSSKRIRN